jgi:hypothetical protein
VDVRQVFSNAMSFNSAGHWSGPPASPTKQQRILQVAAAHSPSSSGAFSKQQQHSLLRAAAQANAPAPAQGAQRGAPAPGVLRRAQRPLQVCAPTCNTRSRCGVRVVNVLLSWRNFLSSPGAEPPPPRGPVTAALKVKFAVLRL